MIRYFCDRCDTGVRIKTATTIFLATKSGIQTDHSKAEETIRHLCDRCNAKLTDFLENQPEKEDAN